MALPHDTHDLSHDQPAPNGIRETVHRAVTALEQFGVRGQSPIHIERVLSLWPHASQLSVDDADRVILLLTTRCKACERPIELVPGQPDELWRHVDPVRRTHQAVPPKSVGSRQRRRHAPASGHGDN